MNITWPVSDILLGRVAVSCKPLAHAIIGHQGIQYESHGFELFSLCPGNSHQAANFLRAHSNFYYFSAEIHQSANYLGDICVLLLLFQW